jgi:hypothetical protein
MLKKSDFDFDETVRYRMSHRQNCIIILVGQQRSGKSYAGLQLCETYDKKFDKEQMIFGMKQFMEFLRSNRKNRWILFDEVGVEFDNVLWFSVPNRVMKYIAETYASRQLHLVMTLPHLSGLLKQTRTLSHFIIRMFYPSMGVLIGIGTDYIHPKEWYQWLQFLEFDYPSKELIVEYEKKKDEFLSKKTIDWSKELGFVVDEDTQKLEQLKSLLASGIRGEQYRSAFTQYMELQKKIQ